MAKNEKTSKKIASKAASLPKRLETAINELVSIESESTRLHAQIQLFLPLVRNVLEDAKSVAMSTLTQAPDKKKKLEKQ